MAPHFHTTSLCVVATEELARDLIGDVVTMLTSGRPYIRKKSTLVLYKLYMQYPQVCSRRTVCPNASCESRLHITALQGLRLTFDNLKRRLTDESPAVVSCAVNVICELARKKPANYLSLAPDLFTLLTTCVALARYVHHPYSPSPCASHASIPCDVQLEQQLDGHQGEMGQLVGTSHVAADFTSPPHPDTGC